MSSERVPVSGKEHTPKGLPSLVSLPTAILAEQVALPMAQGSRPEKDTVSALVEHVAEDLQKNGVSIEQSDIQEAVRQSERSFSPSSTFEPATSPKTKEFRGDIETIDLKEYQRVTDDICRTYGIPKGNWDLMRNILATAEITGNVVDGLRIRAFATTKGRQDIMDKFGQISKELNLKQIKPNELLPTVWGLRKDSQKARRIGGLLLAASAPIWGDTVHFFLERQTGKIVNSMRLRERARLEERINGRISDSLFMRDFEFLHDKSAGEMIEVINNGKYSTIDLMEAAYLDLVPLKVGQIGAVLKQFVSVEEGWKAVDAWFGVAKKLLLDMRLKPNAAAIQKQNDKSLKLLDKMNTKLLTTIQGLETVRTSGNAVEGSDVLYQALGERDFVEAGGLLEKMRQDASMNKLLDVLDVALPLGSETAKLRKEIKAHPERSAQDVLNHVADAYFRVTGSKAQQQALRQSFLALTDLYTRRIVPYIQDIKRMEELLGPYDTLDTPEGPRERSRLPIRTLKNFDISVKNLYFKDILHGVSLDIPQGAFVTIKGKSGIGKSTLFRHLVGLYSATPGAVEYGGVDIDRINKYGGDSLYTKIGYANQNPQYLEDMTLRENLLLWTRQDIPAGRVESVLRDLKLEKLIGRLDSKSKHFSGGEMRRIGIARALLKDPKVLFLDEPTANLDAASTKQVMSILQELRKKRPDMTVVAITHDPEFEQIAERVVEFEKLNKPKLGDRQVFAASAKP